MRPKIITILFACAVSCLAVTLGEGGSQYSIVLSEKASETERLVAEELKENIMAVTGVAAPIVTKTDGRRISIVKASLPSEESWRLVVKDGDVSLLGGGERGVCYAAYEFMERFLDIRWLGVGNKYVPPKGPREIPDNAEFSGTPAFPIFRTYYFFVTDTNQRMDDYKEFHAHNKINGYMEARFGFCNKFGSPRGGHSYLYYSEDFPAEIGWMNTSGKRIKVQNTSSGQICYTHPEVRARIKKKLREYIEKDRASASAKGEPYPLVYDISMNDCNALCHCPECKAEAEKYGVTGLVARFTNDVAASIKDDYPELYVQMFAYKDTCFPPKGGVKMADNVIVRLAGMDMEFQGPIKRDVMRPLSAKQNEEYMELVKEWGRVASNLAIWDYWKMYYETFANPFGGIRNRADYVKLYQDCHAKSIFIEAEIDFKKPMAFYELRAYVALKLMDNPERDVNEIIDDYLGHAFGKEAAVPVKAYIDMLEDVSVADMKPLARQPVASRSYLNEDFFRKSHSLLDEAERLAAGNAKAIELLAMERLVLDLALWNLPRVAKVLEKEIPAERLEARLWANYDVYAKHFWIKTEQKLKAVREEFEQKKNRPPLPEQFRDKDVVDLVWSEIGGEEVVEDADAVCGKAAQLSNKRATGTVAEFHSYDFEFGIYSPLNKQHIIKKTIPKAQLFKDEKYHFYHLGKAKLGEMYRLWMHHSWWLNINLNNLYDPINPDFEYDIYLSLKFEGPSYVKDSKKTDALRVDRAVFVRIP